jgi:ribosomal protection tetracycline resistance protein
VARASSQRQGRPLSLRRGLVRGETPPSVASTEVWEPVEELELDIPEDTFNAVCGALVNARATIRNVVREEASHHIICAIPTTELRSIEQQLPRLTRGDAGWVSSFAGYAPITGEAPARTRSGPNPLNRVHYLPEVAQA